MEDVMIGNVRMEAFEKQNNNHRVTFSPTEKRLTLKYVPGTPDEIKSKLVDIALQVYERYRDSKTTVRFRINPITMQVGE